MKLEVKSDGVWYHGSNMLFTELRTGSTITQWKELAEAFSHQPTALSYDDNGVISNNGKEKGYLYVIDEAFDIQNDIYQHPRTTMDENAEFLTKRPLKVKMVCDLYCVPVKFAVQPDCRPPAKYFPGDITVNPGGLQYINTGISQIGDSMYKINCMNPIAQVGLQNFSSQYEITPDVEAADGILVRSASMHEMELPKGLLAVADAQIARIAAAQVVEEEEDKTYDEAEYQRQVTVVMRMTSIQRDLKIKFVDQKTNKLVANVPFAVHVTDPDGKTSIWSDDDMDGIIYKKDIAPGTYKVSMEKPIDEKYADYIISTDEVSAEVNKDISYRKVDVSDEVKKESEINAAAEDTKIQDTIVESTLQDTVAWVESRVIGAAYNEVPKSVAEKVIGERAKKN